MTELEELTKDKNLKELFVVLYWQIHHGNLLGGTICSHIVDEIEQQGGKVLTKKQWLDIHADYKGIWENPRYPEYKGLRTAMLGKGETSLSIENYHFIII